MTFFVISGFVLQLSLQHGPSSTAAAASKIALARFFRFYPVVAVAVVLSVVYPHATSPTPPTIEQIAANFLLLDVSLNGHLWSLQVELLMIPFILVLYCMEQRWGSKVLLLTVIPTTALVFVPRWAISPGLAVTFFAFVLGMALPSIGRRWAAGLSVSAATRWLIVAGVAVIFCGRIFGPYSRVSTVLESYAGAVLVTLAAYRPDLTLLRWMDSRGLRIVGGAAGSCYVLHMASLPVAITVATAVVPPAWSNAAPGVVGIGVIVVCLWSSRL